jgi:hypothetical protein
MVFRDKKATKNNIKKKRKTTEKMLKKENKKTSIFESEWQGGGFVSQGQPTISDSRRRGSRRGDGVAKVH